MPTTTIPKVMGVHTARMLTFFNLAVLVAASFGVLLVADPAQTATTFAVNRTGDAGDRRLADAACDSSRERGKQCTLRAAIEEANDTIGADVIRFNIASRASVKTISPARPLPTVTEALTIDGYSQPGARANTLATGSDAVLKVQLNGTNADTEAVPAANGLTITAANSTVKGLAINLFSGHGILLAASDGVVQGNFLGTNASGTQRLGNDNGVFVSRSNNTIGGTTAAARNLLSGNDRAGVFLFGSSNTTNNEVQGNLIGTRADGTGDLANADGVFVLGADDNTVGGTGAAGNLISNNDRHGVFLSGGNSSGNEVVGNAIVSNGVDGVNVSGQDNTIGGGNTIFSNGDDGVEVVDSFTQGNSILSNQIFANSGLGIDLEGGSSLGSDVTNNDADDPDTGANNLQNFPVVTSATKLSTGVTTISGTLDSNSDQPFTVQCFLALDGDPSDHGEGQILVAQDTTVQTDASGEATFSCATAGAVAGQEVSATATNTASGDTSEFSLNRTIVLGP